jgi:DMSO reductase family type II enzyme iron-sulfur subunit
MPYTRMKKRDLEASKRQIAMVLDVNKCLNCQTCTIACKTQWTYHEGKEYMYWNNVETRPGAGYPKDWEEAGGGRLPDGRRLKLGRVPDLATEYGDAWEFNHEETYLKGDYGKHKFGPAGDPKWGPNWDEDQGDGVYPNAYFFYLQRICNHCTHPACIEACPRNAIYKRDEDGIVVIDQDRCNGYQFCIEACPFKKIYFNAAIEKSEKCIFCYPRIEKGVANACARQCPGRLRYVGYRDDKAGPIYKLVDKHKVAIPLHPDYGTEPNVFYIPPIAPPKFDKNGDLLDPIKDPRIPIDYLRNMFGPNVDHALSVLHREMKRKREGGESEVMELLIARVWKDNFKLE